MKLLDPKLTQITINGLRMHADHVEQEGFVSAARHMRDAAGLLTFVLLNQEGKTND